MILVTGGAGFIGSHLVDRLVIDGHSVFVADDLSKGKLKNIKKDVKFFKVDIRSNKFTELLQKIKPEIIFHLAAQSSIAKSFKNPYKDFDINLFATLKLLKKAKEIRVKKIIFASSAAVYGVSEKLPIDENDPKNPTSYYGLSKLSSEYFFESYYQRINLNYACLRFANVYGARQDASGEGGVVAIFANNIIRKKPLVIYGSGQQTRDFIYVSDIIDALVKSLDENVIGSFNIGTSKQTPINHLANETISVYNDKPVKIVYKPKRFLEVEKSSLSYRKFKKVTGFSPKTSLEDGFKKTLKYFEDLSNL